VARVSTAICGFRYYSGQRGEIFDFPAETTPEHDWEAPGSCTQGDGRDKPGLNATSDLVNENCVMRRDRVLGILVVAAVAMATGFLVAGQVKAQLLTPS